MADPEDFMADAGYLSVRLSPLKLVDKINIVSKLHKNHSSLCCEHCDRARVQHSIHEKMLNVTAMDRLLCLHAPQQPEGNIFDKIVSRKIPSVTAELDKKEELLKVKLESIKQAERRAKSLMESRLYGARYRRDGVERTAEQTPRICTTETNWSLRSTLDITTDDMKRSDIVLSRALSSLERLAQLRDEEASMGNLLWNVKYGRSPKYPSEVDLSRPYKDGFSDDRLYSPRKNPPPLFLNPAPDDPVPWHQRRKSNWVDKLTEKADSPLSSRRPSSILLLGSHGLLSPKKDVTPKTEPETEENSVEEPVKIVGSVTHSDKSSDTLVLPRDMQSTFGGGESDSLIEKGVNNPSLRHQINKFKNDVRKLSASRKEGTKKRKNLDTWNFYMGDTNP